MPKFENLVNYDGFKSQSIELQRFSEFENLVNYDGFKSMTNPLLQLTLFENLVNYELTETNINQSNMEFIERIE